MHIYAITFHPNFGHVTKIGSTNHEYVFPKSLNTIIPSLLPHIRGGRSAKAQRFSGAIACVRGCVGGTAAVREAIARVSKIVLAAPQTPENACNGFQLTSAAPKLPVNIAKINTTPVYVCSKIHTVPPVRWKEIMGYGVDLSLCRYSRAMPSLIMFR